MSKIQHLHRQTASQRPQQGPWIDIDLGALCANFQMFRDACPGADVAAVVKCDGYGLGAGPVATALREQQGCDTYFVVYAEEGAALRVALNDPAPEIYCFAGLSAETLPLFRSHVLTPVLNSFEEASLWSRNNPNTPAALHIDTGMNRYGAPIGSIGDIAAIKNIDISLVMSHLACASDTAHPMNAKQRAQFVEAAQHFPNTRLSLGASAGALLGRDYVFDMVRPGIALYGGSPFDREDPRVAHVASLRSKIIQLRDLASGEAVGYGATFIAERPTRIATVALGYGDGYPRNATAKGIVMINGETAPLAGRVSMDFITIDVTDLKKPVKVNDIVEFFGPELRLSEVARMTARSPYDLLTGLGDRVDRRYL